MIVRLCACELSVVLFSSTQTLELFVSTQTDRADPVPCIQTQLDRASGATERKNVSMS
jgi:hypothetical protein